MTSDATTRTVDRIRRSLDDFEADEFGLQAVISDLDALISFLEDEAPAAWVDQLRSSWSELEILNAVVLDEGRKLTSEEHREAKEAGRALRSIVVQPKANGSQ